MSDYVGDNEMNIKDYVVVQQQVYNTDEFEAMVRMFIREGWQPFGSPAVSDGRMIQAMVKYVSG